MMLTPKTTRTTSEHPHLLNRRASCLLVLTVTGLLLATLVGCAGPRHLYPVIDDLNAQGEFSQARSYVEEHVEDYGDLNSVLYYLDVGMFAFASGEYDEAIVSFTEAEQLMDELYTISLSQEATTFVINDNTAPYRGEDFESVMANLFLALSYVNLSQVDEALVEARKVDSKLTAINLQYTENEENAYREDPFVRLLMGILYEMEGTSSDLNDAYISYRIALKGYESEYERHGTAVPEVLLENLLSVAQFMGSDELHSLRQRFSSQRVHSLAERRGQAEVYVLHLNGRIPTKIEDVLVVPLPEGHLVKVAFPRYQTVPFKIVGSRLHALPDSGKQQLVTNFSPAEPIGNIAVENLENRKVRIYAKTLARVTAKYLAVREAAKKAREEHGRWAGILTRAAGDALIFASEQADLRSWRTLPAEILISKLSLPPGSYELWAECLEASGGFVQRVDLGTRVLKPGDKILLQFRTTK
jgi:hypothetical protein